ncbi:MAG: hypothetical protein ACP5T0_08295 [Verrucomicrobiia bacterium]
MKTNPVYDNGFAKIVFAVKLALHRKAKAELFSACEPPRRRQYSLALYCRIIYLAGNSGFILNV